LQYVGGDEDMSEIDMDRISLLEVKGHLIEGISDRVLFFGSLRNDLSTDWCVLYIDSGCAKWQILYVSVEWQKFMWNIMERRMAVMTVVMQ
jgi:hypothetical protein